MTAPQGGVQAPGFYRFRVGSLEATLVHDGSTERPLAEGFVRNAPLADVQAALAAACQPTGAIRITFTGLVVNTRRQLVIIDAGNGEAGPPGSGAWMANFRAAGYAPEGEWRFWMDDARMAQAPEAMRPAFEGARRVFGPIRDEVELFAGEREVVPGITALPTPGHTPGHTSFLVEDGGERLLVWSDVTNRPELFVRNPGWHAAFDMDPAWAEATRRRMLAMAAGEGVRVAGYHFPFPATGFIAREGDGYRFAPTMWREGG